MKIFKAADLVLVFVLFYLFVDDDNKKANAQQLQWEKLFDSLSYESSFKPAPRRDAAIGHDKERNRLIIFGGWQVNKDIQTPQIPVVFDDTWEFNLETKIWQQLGHSLNRPTARYGMMYSHNKYGLFISSGKGWLDEYFDDLWIYDFNQNIWHKTDQAFISIIPEARYGAFGGIYPGYEITNDIKTNLYIAHGQSHLTMFENMYVYIITDLKGLNGIWERINTDFVTGPFGFTYPHARMFASSAMLSPDELIVHGGCLSGGFTGGPCPSADSWIFSYSRNKWEQIDSSCISPRFYSSMASIISDGIRKSAILFSGLEKDPTILHTEPEREEEIAVYDSFRKKWVSKRVMGFYFPEKRHGHAMCTGKLQQKLGVFLFGGFGHSSDSNLADVWFLQANISTIFDKPDLVSFKADYERCSNHFTTIHLHSILMFCGWAIFVSLSAVIKRYTYSKKSKTSKIIFKLGIVLEVIGIIIITIGMFFGFYSSRGVPHLAHLSIGIAAYVIIIAQPLALYLKSRSSKTDYYLEEDDKNKPKKPKLAASILDIVYKYSGHMGLCLAITNISLGIFYAVYLWYWVVIWFTYLGLFIMAYLVLEAKQYFDNSKKISRTNNLNSVDYDENFDGDLTKADSTQQLRELRFSASSHSSLNNTDQTRYASNVKDTRNKRY